MSHDTSAFAFVTISVATILPFVCSDTPYQHPVFCYLGVFYDPSNLPTPLIHSSPPLHLPLPPPRDCTLGQTASRGHRSRVPRACQSRHCHHVIMMASTQHESRANGHGIIGWAWRGDKWPRQVAGPAAASRRGVTGGRGVAGTPGRWSRCPES